MAKYKLTIYLNDRDYPIDMRLSSKNEVIDTLLDWLTVANIDRVEYGVVY